MKVSIIISSYNRLSLFKRTLWGIAVRPPHKEFEVIVVDDGSTEDTLGELKLYSSRFPWKFIRFNHEKFTEKTGYKKYFNNPCVTQNIGFKYSDGELIIQNGNEVIPWGKCYDNLIKDIPEKTENFLVVSTTYNIPSFYMQVIDSYGTNLISQFVEHCKQWPLQSVSYRSDVTNYISLCSRKLWENIGGFDERYFAGISAEDSDFVRRARALPNFQMKISEAISLHQDHGGKTCYEEPKPNVIEKARFYEGCAINRKIYDAWDNTYKNPCTWEVGTYGVEEVITRENSWSKE